MVIALSLASAPSWSSALRNTPSSGRWIASTEPNASRSATAWCWVWTAVFSMWVNPRNLNVPGQIKRALTKEQAFIYKAFTSPHHRGKRLYQAGMGFVLADLHARGLAELVGYAHTNKESSRAGLARLEFTSVGHYRVLGYGRRVVLWLSPGLRRRFPRAVPRSGLNIT
jgi:hypothetical protein